MERSVFAVLKDNNVLAQTYYRSNANIHQEQNPGSDIYRIVEGQENLTAIQIRRVGTPISEVEMMKTTLDFSDSKFSDRQHVACIWSQWFPEGGVEAPKGRKVIIIHHPKSQDPLNPDIGIKFFSTILSQEKAT